MRDPFDDDLSIDGNGRLTERARFAGGQEVILHYDDIPDADIAIVEGIPCTTPLRTVIDLAPELTRPELGQMVQHCLERKLFSVEEARARLAEPDMATRPDAGLLRRALPD